jgi:hypothetical protein
MTTPPTPPAPTPSPPAPTPPAPTPSPPAPTPPAPTPPAPNGGPPAADDLAELAAERKARIAADAELTKLRAQTMTDTEKAIADARAEGKAEAEQAAALSLAAAEFRALAAGRIANPDAALAVLDLSKLVKDGQPDRAAIAAVIEQLAVVPPPPPPPGTIPGGPRQPAPSSDGDWLRQIKRSRGG